MPRKLLRKLADIRDGEQLVKLQGELKKRRIFSEFELYGTLDDAYYRLYVKAFDLCAARTIMESMEEVQHAK